MIGRLLHFHIARTACAGRSLRSYSLNIERERNLAGPLELERERQLVALLQRALQVEQHQMIAARRQLHRLARLDHKTLVERTHRHHTVIHGHFVDLNLVGDIRRAADQPVRRRALVLDGEVAAADFGATRRGAAPGLRDYEIAGLDLLGASWGSEWRREERQRSEERRV